MTLYHCVLYLPFHVQHLEECSLALGPSHRLVAEVYRSLSMPLSLLPLCTDSGKVSSVIHFPVACYCPPVRQRVHTALIKIHVPYNNSAKNIYIYRYRDGHGLGSMAIHLAHHCFSFNIELTHLLLIGKGCAFIYMGIKLQHMLC